MKVHFAKVREYVERAQRQTMQKITVFSEVEADNAAKFKDSYLAELRAKNKDYVSQI